MTDENLAGLTKVGPKFGSRWVHRKSGKVYTVQFTALREEDLTPVVVYHSVDNLLMWVRPLAEFVSRFGPLETPENAPRGPNDPRAG